MRKIELLAPAGSLDILKAAVDYGADSVYVGLSKFNARVNAENFDVAQLQQGLRYAHARSSKVFLTVNTLMNDSEFEEFLPQIVAACESGVDGLIIQDLAVMKKLSSMFPDVSVIASTQMNIYSDDEFRKLSEFGVKRVVLPRELTSDEIAKRVRIAARYGMDVEVFAHGAVCVCVSGLCLFSAMNKGGTRSGNRGTCAQPCREEYKLYNDGFKLREGHLLSPKDRDVTDYLSRLITSGVASLKIEGRMRDINYVASAVKAYRTLIDAYYEGTLDEALLSEIHKDLLVNFNRGGSYTAQSLSGTKDENLLSGEYPGKFGFKLGKISRLDAKKGTITFSFAPDSILPGKGDYLSIRSDRSEICSFPIGKLHEMPTELSVKGLHPEQIEKLKPGLYVYLMNHTTELTRDKLRRTPVNFSLKGDSGRITLDAMVSSGINKGIHCDCSLIIPDDFNGSEITHDRITQQLSKTLDTPFFAKNIYIDDDFSFTCPVSMINELRRDVLADLEDAVVDSYCKSASPAAEITLAGADDGEKYELTMFTYPSLRFSREMIEPGADIYCFSLYDMADKRIRDYVISFVTEADAKLAVMLPDFHHDRLCKVIDNVFKTLNDGLGDRFYAVITSKLLSDDEFISEYNVRKFISAGANIYSADSLKEATNYCDGLFMSHELSREELAYCARSIEGTGKTLLVQGEGLIPWMQSDFCCCGQNKKHCNVCAQTAIFELSAKSSGSQKCLAVPHAIDCSCVIYGPAKNLFSEQDLELLSGLDVSTIVNHTFFPEAGEDAGFEN